MELRAFWAVIVRWRWVVILVTVAAILASGALAVVSPPGYKAQVALAFSAPPPPAGTTLPGFDEQNRFLYAEQTVDDFTKIVSYRTFADGVAKRLPFHMEPKQIESAWTIKKEAHHILTIQASAPTEQKALDLVQAASNEITANGQAYYKSLNSPELAVSVIEPPVSQGLTGRLVDYLFIIGRVVVGVVVGIGLAFLLDYMDDRIRNREEAEALGFRVIGTIPRSVAGNYALTGDRKSDRSPSGHSGQMAGR